MTVIRKLWAAAARHLTWLPTVGLVINTIDHALRALSAVKEESQTTGRHEEIRLSALEQVIAGLATVSPLLLWLGNGLSFDEAGDDRRDSISAFHDMTNAEFFYVPLTLLATLMLISGTVARDRRLGRSNVLLSLLLFVVILIDHESGLSWLHFTAAALFFGGSWLLSILRLRGQSPSKRKRLTVAGTMAGLTFLAFAILWPLGIVTLYVAEWIGLVLIALNYQLDSAEYSGFSVVDAANGAAAGQPLRHASPDPHES